MSILSCGRIYIDIQRLSEFAFFSTNKSDKKDKLSHQSLNITSSITSTVYKGGTLVDKNAHFIGTKMSIFNNFGNSSQHLKFDAGQNSTVG